MCQKLGVACSLISPSLVIIPEFLQLLGLCFEAVVDCLRLISLASLDLCCLQGCVSLSLLGFAIPGRLLSQTPKIFQVTT